MSRSRWRFEALDSWFFRESRPHNTVGGTELSCLFPPPARTAAGAIRTLMGEHAGVDWSAYSSGDGTAHRLPGLDLIEEMGDAQGFGKLRLTGPYLLRAGERLYPLPQLVASDGSTLHRLRPGPRPVPCDLGLVRLPQAPEAKSRLRAVSGGWVTGDDLCRILEGGLPRRVYEEEELRREEPRLGIGRDIQLRTAEEALLYQTRHVRPTEGTSVAVEVDGVASALLPPRGLLRFGGEGRMASVEVDGGGADPPRPQAVPTDASGLFLTLLTPADLDGTWLPPGFSESSDDAGTTTWRGSLVGVELTLVACVAERPIREGGWDLASGNPRAVRSLVPAGATWFFRVAGRVAEAAERLHGLRVGSDTEIGRGEVAAGYW